MDGDGGFQFNIQELETVARLNLPIKFFVLNNDGYASIRASQQAWFGSAFLGGDRSTGITYSGSELRSPRHTASLPTSFKIKMTCDVTSAKCSLCLGPVMVDVRVIKEEVRGPRLQSMQLPDGRFVSKPLEDLWPYLPREEFRANMIIPALEE